MPAPSVETLLSLAIADLNAARPSEAIARLGRLKPSRVSSHLHCNLIGLVYLAAEAHARGLVWFDQALALRRDFTEALVSRANALAGMGRSDAALDAFEAAFRAGAADPVAHYNQATILLGLGRLEEAIGAYDMALRLRPAYPEALRAGGAVLRDLGRPEAALRFFDEAVRLNPDYLDAVLDRANLLHAQGRLDAALAAYDAALLRLCGNASLLSNRSAVLHELGRLEEGRASAEAALRADAALAQAHVNLGNILLRLGRPESALDSLETALRLRPLSPEAACSRGLALKTLGRLGEAVAVFDAVLAQLPDFAYARANRAELHLLHGELQKGWPNYEYRFLTGPQTRPRLAQSIPEWTGEPPDGTRIAVLADQGHGDIIHFARYVPLLAEAGASVTFLCPPRMQKLLRPLTRDVRVVETVGEGETFDYQIALSSMPFAFNTSLETIPTREAYLQPEPDLVRRWASRIGPQGFTVGLCWRGSQNWHADLRRSIPLEAFAPLAALPGVRLISLQMPDEASSKGAAMVLEPLGSELDAGSDAFVDIAAAMASLDLVVTCDTSIAHLAGALGRPTWVLLKAVPEWRWMLEREDSPWYRSIRLFRQTRPGDWTGPIDRLVAAIEALRSERMSPAAEAMGGQTLVVPSRLAKTPDLGLRLSA